MPGRVYVSGTPTREGFTGHELDAETGMNYAGARYYMPALGRWTAVDPHAASYPGWSPYNYALDNPLAFTDPDGRDPQTVIAKGAAAQAAIIRTLRHEDRQFVRFNDDGVLDNSLLSSAGSESGNYKALLALSSDQAEFEVIASSASEFLYEGEMRTQEFTAGPIGDSRFSTGETGNTGVSIDPGTGNFQSGGDGFKIYVSSLMSSQGAAESLAHEAYGHAYFYSLGLPWLHGTSMVDPGTGNPEVYNNPLEDQIDARIRETYDNNTQ